LNNEKVFLSTSKIGVGGCSTCTIFKTENLKGAIARLPGVSKVKVDEMASKIMIEYEPQKISLSKITERVGKLGYQVKTVTKEEHK
jgi:copper chaperone CopZ